MSRRVVRKPPSEQSYEEKLKNLAAARAARKSKAKKSYRAKKGTKRKTTVTKKKRTMAKRRRVGDRLTGGTRDVNPQLFSATVTQGATNATTTLAFASPVPKAIFGRANTATVMEVLKVYYCSAPLDPFGAAEEYQFICCVIGTKDYAASATYFSEPTVFSGARWDSQGAFTATGTYGFGYVQPITHDLSDGDGHGVLVASDYIYIQVNSQSQGAAKTVNLKILYRFKNIPIAEYVGIVQSQQ